VQEAKGQEASEHKTCKSSKKDALKTPKGKEQAARQAAKDKTSKSKKNAVLKKPATGKEQAAHKGGASSRGKRRQ
jgi:hypothetical protein